MCVFVCARGGTLETYKLEQEVIQHETHTQNKNNCMRSRARALTECCTWNQFHPPSTSMHVCVCFDGVGKIEDEMRSI